MNKNWNRRPREGMESPSLETLKQRAEKLKQWAHLALPIWFSRHGSVQRLDLMVLEVFGSIVIPWLWNSFPSAVWDYPMFRDLLPPLQFPFSMGFLPSAHVWEHGRQHKSVWAISKSLESPRDPCQGVLTASSELDLLCQLWKTRSCGFQEWISSLCYGKRLWGWFLSLLARRENRNKNVWRIPQGMLHVVLSAEQITLIIK